MKPLLLAEQRCTPRRKQLKFHKNFLCIWGRSIHRKLSVKKCFWKNSSKKQGRSPVLFSLVCRPATLLEKRLSLKYFLWTLKTFWRQCLCRAPDTECFWQKQAQRLFFKKKVFFKISQNSQEKTCVGVSFLIRLLPWSLRLVTLLKRRVRHRCFPVNFAKILRTLFSQKASGHCFHYDKVEARLISW